MQGSQLADYEILEVVGEGSFARVSKVRYKPTGQFYVWKELDYGQMSDKEKQMLVDEVNILRGLNHPNIVRYYDRIIDHQNRKIYIIQEHCDAGDLAQVIREHRNKKQMIPEDFIWSVLSEIASALYACHRKEKGGRVLHRDLKPGNIFLSSLDGKHDKKTLEGLSVKLGDFGLARVLHDQSVFAQTHVGTPYYMSPEQIQFQSYDEKSDIWALGCILYELASLQPPFRAKRYTQLARKIQEGKYKEFGNVSKELSNLISCMLKVEPKQRPSIVQILYLPKVQLTAKLLRADRKYLMAKKLEATTREKERQILDKEQVVKRGEERIVEKERQLQEFKLELERQQLRLVQVDRSLRAQARNLGLHLDINSTSDLVSMASKLSLGFQSDLVRSEEVLRTVPGGGRSYSARELSQAQAALTEPGGGLRSFDRKSSEGSGKSSSTSTSRTSSTRRRITAVQEHPSFTRENTSSRSEPR